MIKYACLLLSGLCIIPAFAQKKNAAKSDTKAEWNVNEPGGPAKSVSFELTE
jgi:hypothetical protein